MSDSSEYFILSVNRTKNPELGDVSMRRMEGLVRGSLMPDPRPGGPLTMVDRQKDLRPCYVQNWSFLVAGASAKDNEDRGQSSTVPATGWDFTGVPGQEPVECGRESQTVSPRRHKSFKILLFWLENAYSDNGFEDIDPPNKQQH